MHARPESHNDDINRHWDELERAAAATDRRRSQGARTDAKDAGIVSAIMPRVSLATQMIQLLYLELCRKKRAITTGEKEIALPDEYPELIHTSHSHIKRYAMFPVLFPQDKVVKAGESRKIIPNLTRQFEYLCADCIICFEEKVFHDWIGSVQHQIFEMLPDIVCLISEEV